MSDQTSTRYRFRGMGGNMGLLLLRPGRVSLAGQLQPATDGTPPTSDPATWP
jgi:hypothetical protein